MTKDNPNKRIPVFLGILFLLLTLGLGLFLLKNNLFLGSRASANVTPAQIRITNITSSSFVASWITKEKATGTIALGPTTKLGEIRTDIRDQNQSRSQEFQVHYVLAGNLNPQTKYFFKILSGGKTYDNSGSPFEVTTAPEKTPGESDIAQGAIFAGQQPAANTLVYLSLANTSIQSALTDSSGHWMIPLSSARTADLKSFSTYDREAQIEEIFVANGEQSSSVTLTAGNDNPAPDIILGQNYNFVSQAPSLSPTPTAIDSRIFPDTPAPSDVPKIAKELTITFPTANEKINSDRPEFFGTGPENQKIDVSIESPEEITGQINIDNKGNWKWNPPSSLTPGVHQITVSYPQKDGFVNKVIRQFTVLATGESDLPSFTATPSGQKVTPSLLPTSLPTKVASPSATLTPTANPARIMIPPTESGVPRTGLDAPTKLFLGAGVITLIVGVALVLF